MTITKQQEQLIQSTFWRVASLSETAAVVFYAQAVEIEPALRRVLTVHPQERGGKFLRLLRAAVRSANERETITAAIENVGIPSAGFGIRPQYYPAVIDALLVTLELGLGEGFTPEVKEAWMAAYAPVVKYAPIDAELAFV